MRTLHHAEAHWIKRMNTMQPGGWNVSWPVQPCQMQPHPLAYNPANPLTAPMHPASTPGLLTQHDGRLYAYRDWVRRVQALSRRLHGLLAAPVLATASTASLQARAPTFLQGYRRCNLARIALTLRQTHHSALQIPAAHVNPLVIMCNAVLQSTRPSGCQRITSDWSPWLDALHLESILNEGDIIAALPPGSPTHLQWDCRYTAPLRSLFCNYKQASERDGGYLHVGSGGWWAVQHRCDCASINRTYTRSHPGKSLIPPGCNGHIVTADPDFLAAAGAGPNLVALMQQGTTFRASAQAAHAMSPQLRADLVRRLQRDVTAFTHTRLQQRLHLPPGSCNAFLSKVHARIAAVVGSRLGSIPAGHLPSMAGSVSQLAVTQQGPAITSADVAQLRRVQRTFVCTVMDKNSTSFVWCCNVRYYNALLTDLNTNSNVRAAAPTYAVEGRTEQQLYDLLRPQLTALDIPIGRKAVPYYYGMFKFHKQPIGMRCISGSRDVMLTPLAVALNGLFDAVQPDVAREWIDLTAGLRGVLNPVPGTVPLHDWNISSSPEFIPFITSFNLAQMAQARGTPARPTLHSSAGGHDLLQLHDFGRLYTNIPTAASADSLTLRLQADVQRAFTSHPGHALCVFRHADTNQSKFVWSNATLSPGRRTVTDQDGTSRPAHVWTATTASAAIHLLIDNTYVKFCGVIRKQLVGIPMGTNPAVHIANMYLRSYERPFLAQLHVLALRYAPPSPAPRCTLTRAEARHIVQHLLGPVDPAHPFRVSTAPGVTPHQVLLCIWQCFALTARFVDDRICIDNPLASVLRYTHQTVLAGLVHGVYPPALDLVAAHAGLTAPYLDMQLVPVATATGMHLSTILYDKRRGAAFSRVHIIRFPHATSALSLRCKLGCINGQFHRMRRIILCGDNFAEEIGLVLLTMCTRGYDAEDCWTRVQRLVARTPGMYGRSRDQLLHTVATQALQHLPTYLPNGPRLQDATASYRALTVLTFARHRLRR